MSASATQGGHNYTESKTGCHPNHGYNFVNSWSICTILSLLQRALNFQQNPHEVTHHTLTMLLHYLGKFKNQKIALCMHVKHVSSVNFYHLSNRYLPNVMKLSAKVNTIHKNSDLKHVLRACKVQISDFYHVSYASAVLGVIILSVRLSVCPSVTRVLCD